MLKVITEAEELELRKQNFEKIKPASLFSFSTLKGTKIEVRYFVAIKKVNNKKLKAIELSEANRKKIINGEACESIIISFEKMSGLNILVI